MLDMFESQHADLAWNKWYFRLFETKCHALAINYFRFETYLSPQHADLVWNEWNFRLFEAKNVMH